MKTGLYDKLDFAEYRSKKEFVSITELNLFLKLPSLYKHQILDGNKPETNKALEEGTALHTAILEPEVFEKIYKPLPDVDFRTKEGKIVKAQTEDLASVYGIKFLKIEAYNRILGARDSLMSHKKITGKKLKPEVSSFNIHQLSQVPIKARFDGICEDQNMLVDLKTTIDAINFEESVMKYGYFRQAAFYLDMFESLTGRRMKWQWWVVEMQPPYTRAVYELGIQYEVLGRNEYERALFDFKKCKEQNFWPSLPEECITIEAPGWYLKKTEQRKQQGEKKNGI